MPRDPMHRARLDILSDIEAECRRQLDKWGIQTHPDGTGGFSSVVLEEGQAVPYDQLAAWAKGECDDNHRRGEDNWESILLEELFEAMAEKPNSPELEAELIQVAAVAVAWLADLRTRQGVGS